MASRTVLQAGGTLVMKLLGLGTFIHPTPPPPKNLPTVVVVSWCVFQGHGMAGAGEGCVCAVTSFFFVVYKKTAVALFCTPWVKTRGCGHASSTNRSSTAMKKGRT